MGFCYCLGMWMVVQVFQLVRLLALFQVALGQPVEQCCTRKTVGDVEYSLVEEEDTSGYNCMTNCVFEKKDSPGSRFCFASGDLPVDCGDGGNSKRQIICNYLPKSDVMEHWKLDLDQKDFETFLGDRDFVKAEGIYANGAKCSAADAEIIKNNLWIDTSSLDMDGFNAVKAAFENNYGCMGVTCDDIGGMGSGSGLEKCV